MVEKAPLEEIPKIHFIEYTIDIIFFILVFQKTLRKRN